MNFFRSRLIAPFAALALTAVTLGFSAPLAHAEEQSEESSLAAVRNKCDFRSDMRKLWEDHVTWTRLFIISSAANLPDKAVTTQRLLKNQVDLGNAIMPFYGRAAGVRLTALLTDHILIASRVVDAAKARDMRRFRLVALQWRANADQIAVFLSGANPRHWGVAALRAMMHEHLRVTTLEASTYLQGNYAASVAAYDQVRLQALHMADTLSSGIILQFPLAFR